MASEEGGRHTGFQKNLEDIVKPTNEFEIKTRVYNWPLYASPLNETKEYVTVNIRSLERESSNGNEHATNYMNKDRLKESALPAAERTATETAGGPIQGPYKITDHITDSGRFAQTFKGTDVNGNLVAIKIFKDYLSKEENGSIVSALDQFETAKNIQMRLQHPNIARVLDAELHNEHGIGVRPRVIMEYIDGRDLQQLMATQPTQDELISFLRQMGSMLEYCQAQETPLVHRDLGPQNIKRTEDGTYKVMDFPFMRPHSEHMQSAVLRTQISGRPGTMGDIEKYVYTPPEMTLGNTKGQTFLNSDIYSVSLTAINWWRGKHDYADENTQLIGMRADLAAFLKKNASFNPAERSKDAKVFTSELEAMVNGAVVKTEEGALPEKKHSKWAIAVYSAWTGGAGIFTLDMLLSVKDTFFQPNNSHPAIYLGIMCASMATIAGGGLLLEQVRDAYEYYSVHAPEKLRKLKDGIISHVGTLIGSATVPAYLHFAENVDDPIKLGSIFVGGYFIARGMHRLYDLWRDAQHTATAAPTPHLEQVQYKERVEKANRYSSLMDEPIVTHRGSSMDKQPAVISVPEDLHSKLGTGEIGKAVLRQRLKGILPEETYTEQVERLYSMRHSLPLWRRILVNALYPIVRLEAAVFDEENRIKGDNVGIK